MKKNVLFLYFIVTIIILCACGKNDKLTASLGPASDGTDSNISGSIYESDDAWSKTENRLENGNGDIKETIELEILGKKYELTYDKSEWNLGVGWVDIYKSQDKKAKVTLSSETGEVVSIMRYTYLFTLEDDYIPSKENGTMTKTEDEFEKLAKEYLEEIFGNIDYDRYTLRKDFALTEWDGVKEPARYYLDGYINGIRNGERIGVEMNEYGDFVACCRKNIGAYDDLDVDYLIDTGLLTDKACEVAGETIKEKYKEYGKEVKEVTYDTDKDVFCLDEDGKPIRIVYCNITFENGNTDSRKVVVGIED